MCRFPNTGDDWYVLVGVARDMILNPKSVGGGFIYTYRLVSGGEKLEYVHKVGSPGAQRLWGGGRSLRGAEPAGGGACVSGNSPEARVGVAGGPPSMTPT